MKYNPKKIVIFDWGGIVESHKPEENSYTKIIIDIIKSINPNIDTSKIIPFWRQCISDENGKRITTTGDIKELEKWFNRLKHTFDLKCDLKTFNEIYQKEFEKVDYYKNVIKLEYETKEKCKIGILSDLMPLDKERLGKQIDLNKFDYVWLSFEVGVTKPNDKIYEIVEKDCKIEPKNILFIDDLEKNIETARNRGWKTCNSFGYEINKINSAIDKFLQE